MDFPIATTVSAASAALSAVAAFAAWHATRRAASAAERANTTADTVARIERDRRRGELRPQLSISLRDAPGSGGNPDYNVLRFGFPGPNDLEPYGPLKVTVTVRDDRDRSHDNTLPGGLTAEEIAAHVWGPWKLQRGTDNTDDTGRTCPVREVRVGEELRCAIERTRSPHTHEGAQEHWRRDYTGTPMRLRIEVECKGFDPWVFLEEFDPDAVSQP